VKLTYDDFVLFPDDGKRHELIDGEHYVTPSPNIRHQQIQGDLFGLDPDINVVRVYRRDGDAFGRPGELSRETGDALTTPLLPGLEMPLARIFRE
jgi:Uma2 family endonuclease